MKKTITMITAALLLGTQALIGAILPPTPPNLRILTLREQVEYRRLQAELRNCNLKYCRNKGSVVFLAELNEIKRFVSEDPGRTIYRGEVCGVFWFG